MLLHQFYIEDTSVRSIGDFTPPSGVEVYEVVRVVEGIPLFLEEHLTRFFRSAWLFHLEIPFRGDLIESLLRQLISVNGVKNGNIRFSWCWRPSGKFRACFIPHKFPSSDDLRNGVSCGLLHAERRDPGVKVVQAGLRDEADRMIREEGWYEVILVSRNGFITEGSRSNLFFVRQGVLITAPDEEVLPGITRQKVMEFAVKEGLPLETRALALNELKSCEALFITGTSPKVLPVREAEGVTFQIGHPVVTRLIKGYDDLIENYIITRREASGI